MVSLSIIDNFWDGYFHALLQLDWETMMRWGWFILLLDIPRYLVVELLVLIWSRSRRIVTRKNWKQARRLLWEEYPLVTVLAPGHNEGRHLSKLLASMEKQTYRNIELIVVDDCSTDDTAIIGQSFEKAGRIDLFLRCNTRGGKASAANLGLRYAKGKFVVHLDADSSLKSDAIENILVPFFRYKLVGAVGGNLVVRNENDSLTATMQYLEYIQSISIGRIVLSKLGIYKIVSGAFGAFPRKLLDRMGGWDIGPGLDGDITVKIRKLGYKVLFEENALCETHVPTTWKALTKQRRRWSRSLVRFRLRKHRDVWAPDRNFSLLNFISFFENIFFGLILDFLWILYTLIIILTAPGFLLIWFPIKYTIYLAIALIQYTYSLFVIDDKETMLRKILYIPLMPLYMGYYMRFVRTWSYLGELFFYESYKDVWNPANVSKKAKEFGL